MEAQAHAPLHRRIAASLVLEMVFAMPLRVPGEIVRPVLREALCVVRHRQRPHRRSHLAVHRAVVREDLPRGAPAPPAVEHGVLIVDALPAELEVERLSASEGALERAQRVLLPGDDVRERIPPSPLLALRAGARAEAGDRFIKALRAEPPQGALKRAVLRLDARDRVDLVVRDPLRRGYRRNSARRRWK